MLDKAQIERQRQYCRTVASVLGARIRGREPLAYIHTYGCQGNVADSERISGMLVQMGYKMTDEPQNADFILRFSRSKQRWKRLKKFKK